MKLGSDLVKTVGAILIIAIIVVATFLYGNHQRQEQVRKDQAAKQEQQRKADEQAKQVVPAAPQPSGNTVGASATPVQTSAPANGKTPSTGGELGYLIPATALFVAFQANRRSKRSLHQALRAR